MEIISLHSWDVSPQEAIQIQLKLKEKIIKEGKIPRVRLVSGVDVGFPSQDTAQAAVVVLSFPDLKVIEEQTAEVPVNPPRHGVGAPSFSRGTRKVTFPYFRAPARKRRRGESRGLYIQSEARKRSRGVSRGSYIPGLLAFREAPAVLAAIKKLEKEPDLFIFDAQGYAHPRRMGLATHLGLFLDKPAIGCAKSKLTGNYQVPGNRVGDRTDLIDNSEIIGAVVRTRPGSPPLFISIGHKISLDEAVKHVLACTKRGNRLPETTRLAHKLASLT